VFNAALAAEDSNTPGLPESAIKFNIPGKQLASALSDFQKTSGVNVIFPDRLVKGKTSRKISGDYPPASALKILLESTGLTYKVTAENTVVIKEVSDKVVPDNTEERKSSKKNEHTNKAVDMDRMVVTATMTEKEIEKAPGSIEVITEQNILEMNAETLAEALEDAADIMVVTAEGKQKAPRIRGMESIHSLVLIDGRRLPSGFKGVVDIEHIPVNMIERIEIVRGPASALYGTDALGGVINIITKKSPDQFNMGVTAQYGQRSYSDQHEEKLNAFIGNSWNRFGFFLSGGVQGKDYYDLDDSAPNDGDDITLKTISGRFTLDINDNNDLMAGFEYIDKNDIGLRYMQKQNREWDHVDERSNYFIRYNNRISPLFKLMLRANHSDQKNRTDLDPPTSTVDGYEKSDLDQLEGRVTGILGKHLLTFGSEYRDIELEEDSGTEYGVENISFYSQDEYQVLSSLYLVFGLRFDDHSEFGSEWTPRTSLVYSIFNNLRLKASYGTGFRAPTISELFITSYRSQGKTIYEPNPDLDPETSNSYEIGLEGEYKSFTGKLTAFRNEIKDLIDAEYYGSEGSGNKKISYYRYLNISRANISGLEFEWDIDMPYGFLLSGNLAYLDTEDEETGEELTGRPDLKGSVKLRYNHMPTGINANIRMKYFGDRYSAGDDDEDAYTMVNFYFSKKLTDRIKLFTGVDNIFNSGKDEGKEPTLYFCGFSLSYR
jgi:outer membrane receptor for ferrienterochelin and colicins